MTHKFMSIVNPNRACKHWSSPKIRFFLVALGLLGVVSFEVGRGAAQQPSTSTAPIFNTNAKYVNGVGPGYWPTAGALLSLILAPGTATCGSPPSLVTYPGGALTMTASQTNYVFLDPSLNCAPSSNTAGFVAGQVPLAKVLTSSTAITTIIDARNWFVPQPIGTDSTGNAVTKFLNSLRFADQFPGSSGTAKLDAAIANIGSGPGVVIAVPGTGTGDATTYPNNISVLDFRQTTDLIDGVTSDPDRSPILLLENHLGELTTKPFSGTVTLTSGSTTVTGVGTKFLTEIGPSNPLLFPTHLGRSIKLNADATTAWAEVASVTDDTHATLKVNYPGTGGSGPASYFITQLGIEIDNVAAAGTPNTPSGGESVGLSVVSNRSAGRRPMFGANLNTNFSTVPATNVITDSTTASALEIDFNNNSPSDVIFPWVPLNSALHILSAGTKKAGSGLSIFRTANGINEFGAGIWINQSWDTTNTKGAGIRIDGASNHILLVPSFNNTNQELVGKSADETNVAWSILANGGAFFGTTTGVGNNAVGFGTSTPNVNSRVHAYTASNTFQIPIRIENANSGTGTAAIGLGVAASYESSAFKGGIGLIRQAANGVGNLILYNRITGDAGVDFIAADAVFTSSYQGAISLTALGTNQNIALTPSGTGYTLLNGNVGIGTAAPSAKLNINSAGGGTANLFYSGPPSSGFTTNTQGYLGATQQNVFASLNSATAANFAGVMGVMQDSGTATLTGVYGEVEGTNAGTKYVVTAVDGDAYFSGAGTVSNLAGVTGFAQALAGAGTVGIMASFQAPPNVRTAGTVSLNAGLYLGDQTGVAAVAANNYEIYTNNLNHFVVRADGKVGIGRTAPAQSLDVNGSMVAALNTVTASATPTFDASLGNTQTITLTANVTSSTLSNCTAGESLVFDIIQDATGGRTFVWPTNVLNAGTIGATASKHNIQTFYCDGTNARATGAMLTNQN